MHVMHDQTYATCLSSLILPTLLVTGFTQKLLAALLACKTKSNPASGGFLGKSSLVPLF